MSRAQKCVLLPDLNFVIIDWGNLMRLKYAFANQCTARKFSFLSNICRCPAENMARGKHVQDPVVSYYAQSTESKMHIRFILYLRYTEDGVKTFSKTSDLQNVRRKI